MQQTPEESSETVPSFKQELIDIANKYPDQYCQKLTEKIKEYLLKEAKSGLREVDYVITDMSDKEFNMACSCLKKNTGVPFTVRRGIYLDDTFIFTFKW